MAIQTTREIEDWISCVIDGLRPCPFCGSRPIFHPTHPEHEGNAWALVRCEDAECPTFIPHMGFGVSVSDGSDVADERGTTGYMRAAMDRWNSRAK
jgi:hypothetical protein